MDHGRLFFSTEAIIPAPAQSLFDIAADFAGHTKLAGSEEVLSISLVGSGPVGFGTVYECQEKVRMGEDSMELGTTGVVVTYDPPNTLSWINTAIGVPLRRIQWWFHFKPEGTGTKVIHEVEVDFGELTDPMLISFRDNYEAGRAPYVRDGMKKTLENLAQAAR